MQQFFRNVSKDSSRLGVHQENGTTSKTLLQRPNGIREEKGEALSTFLPVDDGCSGGTGSRINVREYRRRGPEKGNPEKLATRRRKTKQHHSTICVGHHYTQTNTNNVNKTYTHLQRTGSKEEPNLVVKRKSQRTSQHGTWNVKAYNRTTQKLTG